MKTCSVEGCDVKAFCKGFCGRHYKQMSKHGKIMAVEYNRFHKNKTIDKGDHLAIELYSMDGIVIGEALVSNESYEKLKDYKWFKMTVGYAASHAKGSKKIIHMHNLVMDTPKGKEVDHINGNKLDNRIDNLRICSHRENTFNSGLRANSSGFRGVSYEKDRRSKKKWLSSIAFNGNRLKIGRFESKKDAIEARICAELKYFGEYAPTISRGIR